MKCVKVICCLNKNIDDTCLRKKGAPHESKGGGTPSCEPAIHDTEASAGDIFQIVIA